MAQLISGHTGKSDLAKEVIKQCGVVVSATLDLSPGTNTCVVIDAMHIVNTIVPKPAWITTGDDLAKEFAIHVDDRSQIAYLQWLLFSIHIEIYR